MRKLKATLKNNKYETIAYWIEKKCLRDDKFLTNSAIVSLYLGEDNIRSVLLTEIISIPLHVPHLKLFLIT